MAAVTPGPSNVMLTAAGANAGVVRGLPCLFGVTLGMGLMMFVVPLGLGSLLLKQALVLKALHWGGAADRDREPPRVAARRESGRLRGRG